jgi:hypothetical protein
MLRIVPFDGAEPPAGSYIRVDDTADEHTQAKLQLDELRIRTTTGRQRAVLVSIFRVADVVA